MTGIVNPSPVLVVTDTTSVVRPADKGTPHPDDTGYHTYLRAFNRTDLVDLHTVPFETYSCFHGAAGSRIDTVACHQ